MWKNIVKRTKNNTRAGLLALGAAGLVFAMSAPAVLAVPTDVTFRLGDSRPGQTSTYTIDLSTVDTTTTECITIDLEAGDATNADLDSSTLLTVGSWSDSSTQDQLVITNDTGEQLSASGNIVWSGVVNGSTPDTAYEATYTSYEDSDCSTGQIETVTVQYIYTEGTDVSLTVDPSFTFTVAGVADSQSVNGATTTVTTTANTVPFGLVTTSANQIAAQDLTISTNAANGYTIYTRYTGAPSNGSGGDIDDVGNTYASPDSFTAAGTEAFGFTTDNVPAFTSDTWADMDTSDVVAGSSDSAITGEETTRVGYQVGVSTETAPGTYTTTIIYTGVPTY